MTHGTRKNAKGTMAKFAGQAEMFPRCGSWAASCSSFPPPLNALSKNEDYLRWAGIQGIPGKVRVVIEFRRARWIED